MRSTPIPFRLTPLAALVLSSVAPANTLTVQNCSDDPGLAGTLRKTIAAAMPGDTVDLSALKCSTITLTNGGVANGPLVIDKAMGAGGIGLKIAGPGADKLSIDGAYSDRVLTHTGSGQLIIEGLTITRGYINAAYVATPPKGGCIASYSTLTLTNTTVSHCGVVGTGNSTIAARGGGIYAKNLTLTHSIVTASSVSNGSAKTYGGGLFAAGGTLGMHSSTVSNNSVGTGLGGGIFANQGSFFAAYSSIIGNTGGSAGADLRLQSSVNIFNTTIANNVTPAPAKGIGGLQVANASTFLLEDSTISGNDSNGAFGGLAVYTTTKSYGFNNTIAFNAGVGISLYKTPMLFESTVVSNNSATDLYIANSASISGSANLVMSSNEMIPSNFLAADLGTDPKLAPLRNNGGPTLTHMLLPDSPAIGAGKNTLAGSTYDQRGILYPRATGPTQKIDVGAVQYDTIFADGCEGGP